MKSNAPPLLRRLALQRERIAVDVRSDAAWWARSVRGWRGWELRACGRVERAPEEELDALLGRLARTSLRGRSGATIALRSPELEHRRVDLPALSSREARAVAARRASDLAREQAGEVTAAYVLPRGRGARPLWLCTAPLSLAAFLSGRWAGRGMEVSAIASHHLALGNLARALPEKPPGALTAILDFEPEHATCVVVDGQGWLFSRQIPLKFAGEKRLQAESDLDLDADAERIEVGYTHAERITTELTRTLRYVQSVLGLGDVADLVLAGEDEGLAELAPTLAANLELPVRLLGDAIAAGPGAGAHPAASVALGMALSPDPNAGNLLPAPARRARAQLSAGRRLRLALAAAVSLCALGAGAWSVTVDSLEAGVAELDAQWRALASQRSQARAGTEARARAGALAAALDAIHRPEPSWTALLDALGRLAPHAAALEQVRVIPQGDAWQASLVVQAYDETVSDAAAAVSALARSLDESPLFALDRVVREPLPPRARAAVGLARVRFRIEGRAAPLERSAVAPAPASGGAPRG